MAREGSFSAQSRRPRVGTIVLIVLFHVAAIYGLAKAFAPDMTGTVEQTVVAAFTVTVTVPEEEPPPEAEPKPDEGAQGDPGKKAVPKPVTAPTPKVPLKPEKPAPRASSTGTADTSGAKEQGEGTGAAGQGLGTGSGREGGGQAGKPVKTAGNIANVRDYPIPPGGREARVGTSVTIAITVGTDGLPKGCRIVRPSPFPETNQRTCELAMQRFRFKPATNASGQPVQSVYGWKQDFFN